MPNRNFAPEYRLTGGMDMYYRQPFRGPLPGELATKSEVVDEFTDYVRGTESSDDVTARALQAAKIAEAGIAPDHLYDACLPQNQAVTLLFEGGKL